MNTYKQIFKLLKSSYGIFMYVVIYLVVMIFIIGSNSSNTVNQNAKKYGVISVELKENNVFSKGLRQYLERFYTIEEIKDYSYAINTTYSVGHVIIKNEDEIEIIQASELAPLKLHIDQYVNATKQNDFSLLERRVTIEQVSSKSVLGLSEFFKSFAMLIFGISGMFVLSFIKPLMSKHVIEKIRLSSTSMTQYSIEIFLALCSIMFLIVCIASGFAIVVLGAKIPQLIWPVINAMIYFAISIFLLLFIFAITSNEDVVMVVSNALGVSFVMISGSFFPFEFIPKPIQTIAKLLPTYYYNQLVSGFNLNFLLIQIGFIAVLALATINVLKYNQSR